MVVTLGSPLGAFSLLLARSLKTHFTVYTAEQQEHFFFQPNLNLSSATGHNSLYQS